MFKHAKDLSVEERMEWMVTQGWVSLLGGPPTELSKPGESWSILVLIPEESLAAGHKANNSSFYHVEAASDSLNEVTLQAYNLVYGVTQKGLGLI